MASDITRENWAAQVAAAGIRLETICHLTGQSYWAVDKYRKGQRRPPEEFLAQVAVILRERAA